MKHTFKIGDRVRVWNRSQLDGYKICAKFLHLGQPYVALERDMGDGCQAIHEGQLIPYEEEEVPVFKVGDAVRVQATGGTGKIIRTNKHPLGILYTVLLGKIINTFSAEGLELVSKKDESKFKVGDIVKCVFNKDDLGIIIRASESTSNAWFVHHFVSNHQETRHEDSLTLVK